MVEGEEKFHGTNPNPNDIVSETIQRAQQQQPEAIEKLVHHIERIARKSFGDFSVAQADCDDLVQDVVLAIYQKYKASSFILVFHSNITLSGPFIGVNLTIDAKTDPSAHF